MRYLESKQIKTVAIVGAGRMGAWFAKYFRDLSCSVFLFDTNEEKAKQRATETGVRYLDSIEEVSQADLAILSVPISENPKNNSCPVRQVREFIEGAFNNGNFFSKE